MEERKIKLGCIVIDYINILSNFRNPNFENTYLKIKQIAEDLKISSGKMYISDTNQQAKGIRVVQDNYERVKYLIVNLCSGKFPITTKP